MAIKLFKFGAVVAHLAGVEGPGARARSNVCYELATVVEGKQERSITTCSGEERESVVYISVLSSGSFLLYYEGEFGSCVLMR